MYTSLSINGQFYDKNALLTKVKTELSTPNQSAWNLSFYQFISDWLSESSTISLQTSGSSGTPKKITAKKSHLIASALATVNYFKLNKGCTFLLCLPCDYIAGKMMIVRAFVCNANIICVEPKSNALTNIPTDKIDLAAVVPMQLEKYLSKRKQSSDKDFSNESIQGLSNIEHLIIGGSALNNETFQQITKLPCKSYLTYGMTETYSHVALQRILSSEKSGTYKALPSVCFNVNKENQLIINASHLGIDNLVTNDIVNLISSIEFELIGRIDNVINSGGIKLSPEKIENKIAPYFENTRYFIHAIPDKTLGQTSALFIESSNDLKTALSPDFTNLIAMIKANLPSYEVPKEIILLDKFSLTSSGKIQRKKTATSALFNAKIRTMVK